VVASGEPIPRRTWKAAQELHETTYLDQQRAAALDYNAGVDQSGSQNGKPKPNRESICVGTTSFVTLGAAHEVGGSPSKHTPNVNWLIPSPGMRWLLSRPRNVVIEVTRKGERHSRPSKLRRATISIPSMNSSLLLRAIWISGTSLQAVIAIYLLSHQEYRSYPAFFCYTVFHVFLFVSNCGSHIYSEHAYIYAYWFSEVFASVLALTVSCELFLNVMNPYSILRRRVGVIFCVSTLSWFVLAGVAAAFEDRDGVTDGSAITAGLLALQQAIGFIVLGLVIFLAVFSRMLGLCWRDRSVGIAMGLAVHAAKLFLSAAIYCEFGECTQILMRIAVPSSYILTILIWGYYFLILTDPCGDKAIPSLEQLVAWRDGLRTLNAHLQREL
jgi:hypothetical protein